MAKHRSQPQHARKAGSKPTAVDAPSQRAHARETPVDAEAEALTEDVEGKIPLDDPVATAEERSAATEQLEESENRQTLGSLGASTGIISICTIISRLTGFARTWAMAYALGATFLASSYQVANNLPNMLYELVMGGMLATAFLPVYVSLKKNESKERSNEYASNLLCIIVIVLGAVTVLCFLFPQAIIYTQSFYSDQETMGTAVLLFQFFAVQTVFYGASTIMAGLLDAHRDYFWPAAAPIANNLIVIITFIMYAFMAPQHPTMALYIIAIGNPLGVVAQFAFQLPALRRNGIRLRPHLNFRDPALRDTLSIGVPALWVMVCSFITVSVMNAAAYAFADNGPSILAYSRLWYTLPYSFIAIPIQTTLFTEMADLHAADDKKTLTSAVAWGSSQITFLLIPFMFYLMVFSFPLVDLYHVGAFTNDNVAEIAWYLIFLVIGLPLYGLSSFLQIVFSTIRRMRAFAIICTISTAIQVAVTMLSVTAFQAGWPIPIGAIALASALFYFVANALSIWYMKRYFGTSCLGAVMKSAGLGLVFGGLGAAAGFAVLNGLVLLFGPYAGSVVISFIYVVISGLVALFVTFGLALKCHVKEAQLISSLVGKVTGRLKRNR